MARLAKNDWIEYGLHILKVDGFTSLKADVLAKGLKVSRGSFYWHFKDVSEYHNAILAHWVIRSVQTANNLDASKNPKIRLKALITAASKSDHKLERSIRAWGQSVKIVEQQIDTLDAFRMDALRDVISEILDDKVEASRRAKILYASAIGLSQIESEKIALSDEDIDALVELFLS